MTGPEQGGALDRLLDILDAWADAGAWHDLSHEDDVRDPDADSVWGVGRNSSLFMLSHYPNGDVCLLSSLRGGQWKRVTDVNAARVRALYRKIITAEGAPC